MQTNVRVSVTDVLSARDQRVQRQRDMLFRHHLPQVSFTMNVAGDVKVTQDILRAFLEGVSRIKTELARLRMPIMEEHVITPFTGCEALFAVSGDACAIKEAMSRLEDMDALGRLFDMDVTDENGCPLKRGKPRKCLICDEDAFVCARQRAHSALELQAATHRVIRAYFDEKYVRHVGEKAQQGLLFEAVTTPKPGLVDMENAGVHRDMDIFSFMAGAASLRPYFEDCVRLGMTGASVDRLQFRGMEAERDMLSAARVNTHKGAVFALGILCYACGRRGENASAADVLQEAACVGQELLLQLRHCADPKTGGEMQYQMYGLTGARGEAAKGFPHAAFIALPVLEEALKKGYTVNDAGLCALAALIAHVDDSNVIRRGGMEALSELKKAAKTCMADGDVKNSIRTLDAVCTRYGVSPGGCADLLAVTYFLHLCFNQQ